MVRVFPPPPVFQIRGNGNTDVASPQSWHSAPPADPAPAVRGYSVLSSVRGTLRTLFPCTLSASCDTETFITPTVQMRTVRLRQGM